MTKIQKRKLPESIRARGGSRVYEEIYEAIEDLAPGDAFLCFHDEADDQKIIKAAGAIRAHKYRTDQKYRVFVDIRDNSNDRGIWVEKIG